MKYLGSIMKRFALALIFSLMVCFALFSFQQLPLVNASNTIYIRADGTVDPPLILRNGDVYSLTGDIVDSIEIQRDNITLDGARYVVQGTGISDGISVVGRNNVKIKNLQIRGFKNGVYVSGSSGINISYNKLTGNSDGVYLLGSSNNILVGNNLTNNQQSGIWLSYSSNSTLMGNVMSGNNYNLEVDGSSLSNFMHSIKTSNLVNGKPVYYLVNQTNMVVNREAGYLGLVNCVNITAERLNLMHNWHGLLMVYTNNSRIAASNIVNNWEGAWLWRSSNNILVGNNITSNGHFGIYLYECSSNRIYHNNIIQNADQAGQIYSSGNFWDDGFEGNYWSNYNGDDTNRDGIGDMPNTIPPNSEDLYPLMGSFHSFNVSYIEQGLTVDLISNSTVSNFNVSVSNEYPENRIIRFNVAGESGLGFCRIRIPHALMAGTCRVTIDGAMPHYVNYTLYYDSTNRWLYFNYQHSSHRIMISNDVTPPAVSVLSPENKTYQVNNLALTFTINKPTIWIGYSLDNQANITIMGNTTLSSLTNGLHHLTVYAQDAIGNIGASEKIYFTINVQQSPQTPESTSFPTWIIAAIAIAVVAGTALLFYFVKIKKKTVEKNKPVPANKRRHSKR